MVFLAPSRRGTGTALAGEENRICSRSAGIQSRPLEPPTRWNSTLAHMWPRVTSGSVEQPTALTLTAIVLS